MRGVFFRPQGYGEVTDEHVVLTVTLNYAGLIDSNTRCEKPKSTIYFHTVYECPRARGKSALIYKLM